MLDLNFLASLVGLVAVIVTTGIITVGASTLLTAMGTKAFEFKNSEETGIITPVFKGEEAKKFRNRIAILPSNLLRAFCFSQALVLLLAIGLVWTVATSDYSPQAGKFPLEFTMDIETKWVETYLAAMTTIQLVYIFYLMINILIIKQNYYGIIGAKVME